MINKKKQKIIGVSKDKNIDINIGLFYFTVIFISVLKLFFSLKIKHLNYTSYKLLVEYSVLTEIIKSIGVNPEISVKLYSFLFSIIIPVLVYAITKEIIDKKTGIIAGYTSIFIPYMFMQLNNFEISFFIALIYLFNVYFFLKSIRSFKYMRYLIISIFIMLILTEKAIVFIIGFLIYFLLLATEKMKIKSNELELWIFTTIVGSWILVVLHKQAISNFKLMLVKSALITKEFILAFTGIFVILAGFYGIYVSYNKIKRKSVFLLSQIITFIIFRFMNLIDDKLFIICVLLFLNVFSAYFVKSMFNLKKNLSSIKIFKIMYNLLVLILIVIFIISAIVPSIINGYIQAINVPDNNIIMLFKSVNFSNLNNSKIISTDEKEFFASYISGLSTAELDQKEKEIMFNYSLSTETIKIMSLKNIKFIFLDGTELHNLNKYVFDKFKNKCFIIRYVDKNGNVFIFDNKKKDINVASGILIERVCSTQKNIEAAKNFFGKNFI